MTLLAAGKKRQEIIFHTLIETAICKVAANGADWFNRPVHACSRSTEAIAKSLVCRLVFVAGMTSACQAVRRDEFSERFRCIIQGVGFRRVSRLNELPGLFMRTGVGGDFAHQEPKLQAAGEIDPQLPVGSHPSRLPSHDGTPGVQATFFCEAQLSAKGCGPTELPPSNRLAPATTTISRCGRGIQLKTTGIRPILGRMIARHVPAGLSPPQCHP